MNNLFLDAAISIGNALCRDALRYQDKCTWIGCTADLTDDGNKTYHQALKGDWYSGTSGIGWFLANLARVSQDKRHATLAREAIRQALDAAADITYGKLGFHTGYTGIAFAAVSVGEILHDQELTDRGLHLLQSLHQIPETEYALDIVDGCAGAIPAIARIAAKHPGAGLDTLLEKMGSYLLSQAQPEQTGTSWNTMPQGTTANLTGFAHGAAGISYSLLELYAYTKNDKYKQAAQAGFAYEEACFDPNQKNWPDFRDMSQFGITEEHGTQCSCTWCHGAPGIGMARLRAYEITGEPAYLEAGRIATETTARMLHLNQLNNYSLCHGLFGNGELLLHYADVSGEVAMREKVLDVAQEGIEKYLQRHVLLPNGAQSDFTAMDFMLGQAGMGYSFLRLADEQQFAPVLVLR